MVCYIIKEKFNWKLKIHASNLQLFVVSRKLELWKSENVSKSENKTDKIPWQRDEMARNARSSWTKHTLNVKQMKLSMSQKSKYC